VASSGLTYVALARQVPAPRWSLDPAPFKLYPSSEREPLGGHWPGPHLTLRQPLDRDQLGQFLRSVNGLTRLQQASWEALFAMILDGPTFELQRPGQMRTTLGRPIPSGGAFYPGEVYVVLGGGQRLPAGVYHYDPCHHILERLRPGDHRPALQASLPGGAEALQPLTLVLGCRLWKNAHKYGSLGYRLHTLDLGVLVGQCLETARRHEAEAIVHFLFLDAAVNALLGLQPELESAYALVSVEIGGGVPLAAGGEQDAEQALVSMPAALGLERESSDSASLTQLAELHRDVLAGAPAALAAGQVPALDLPGGAKVRALPAAAEIDLSRGFSARRSAVTFTHEPIRASELAGLLAAAGRGYSSDIDGRPAWLRHTTIYLAANAVEGVEPGLYQADLAGPGLVPVPDSDHHAALQTVIRGFHVNAFVAALNVFAVACYEQGLGAMGDRWYRVQNMELGILIQRIYLAAAVHGLGCRASLGFDVEAMDRELRLPPGLTCVVHLVVGHPGGAGQSYEQAL
jgi:SagB-type dehydrogenase family enzyme